MPDTGCRPGGAGAWFESLDALRIEPRDKRHVGRSSPVPVQFIEPFEVFAAGRIRPPATVKCPQNWKHYTKVVAKANPLGALGSHALRQKR
jgi:hypothetical protein